MATIGHTMPQPMTTISHLLFIRYGLVCLLGCSSSLAGFLGIEFSMRTEAPARIRGRIAQGASGLLAWRVRCAEYGVSTMADVRSIEDGCALAVERPSRTQNW